MAIKFTDGLLGSETVSFETIVCYNCKVPFMVTSTHRKRLVDEKTTFYCPNGHPQHYTENDCDIEKRKLKQQIESEKKRAENLNNWNNELITQREDLKHQVTELRKKDCTICGKRYINLDAHIRKSHPNL